MATNTAYMQAYYAIHRERMLEQGRRWRRENRGRANAHKRAYAQRRRMAMPFWADRAKIVEIYEAAVKRPKKPEFRITWTISYLFAART